MADWAEFRADRLRKDADAVEQIVGTEAASALAAVLRRAAEIIEEAARLWRDTGQSVVD